MAKNKKKQHSITTQITLTIVGLVAGTVLLCWLLNVTLLEGYYTRYKQEVLENGFQQINAASEQGILNTSDFNYYIRWYSSAFFYQWCGKSQDAVYGNYHGKCAE